MTLILAESELPVQLTELDAVNSAYGPELTEAAMALTRGQSCLIECEKDLTAFAFMAIRDRLRPAGLTAVYVDGAPTTALKSPGAAISSMASMLIHLREVNRVADDKRVVVLPHFDLLVANAAGLTAEGREVIPLLHEQPRLVCRAFRDPSLPLPRSIESFFPHRLALMGVVRSRFGQLVCRGERRKFGQHVNVAAIHKFVSGLNALRLRRVLATLDGIDLPADATPAIRQLRSATLVGGLQVPAVDLETDVGGCEAVKRVLRDEILAVQARRDACEDAEELARLDDIMPRGLLLIGPGTGKRLIVRALASSLNAALLTATGPELMSRFLGGSEENVRQLFLRARQAAPTVILFQQFDALITSPSGNDVQSAVAVSMLSQALIEMDHLRGEEMVLVVATTERADRLAADLRRPGRFELAVVLPYPDAGERRAILRIIDRKLALQLTPEALDRLVERTSDVAPRGDLPMRHTGADLHALCRALARRRAREGRSDATTVFEVDSVFAR